jgi:hypothetical protein
MVRRIAIEADHDQLGDVGAEPVGAPLSARHMLPNQSSPSSNSISMPLISWP